MRNNTTHLTHYLREGHKDYGTFYEKIKANLT